MTTLTTSCPACGAARVIELPAPPGFEWCACCDAGYVAERWGPGVWLVRVEAMKRMKTETEVEA